MDQLQHQRVRKFVVAAITGVLVLPVLWTVAPMSAHAAACTRTVKGDLTENIVVASGERLCLKKANLTGDITVAAGGSLRVHKSAISGAVDMQPGYLKIKFCGSSTGGAITAVGGSVQTLVGGKGCKGNTIGGAVTMNENQAGMQLSRNSIGGAVTANSNQGGTTISANTIAGALSCATNTPVANNAKKPNSVTGAQSGECAAPF